MTLAAARQVADAVLYEGYLLYPYRASSAKNQVRWQFGVLGPEGAAEAGAGEEPALSAQVLVEPQPGARLDVHLRFLQVQSRVVERRAAAGYWVSVAELTVGGTRWIPFHEAVSREISLPGLALAEQQHRVSVPSGEDIEELHEDGRVVGRLVRRRWGLDGTLAVSVRPGQDPRLVVVGLRVDNHTEWSPGAVDGWSDRDVAARYSFVGTHLLVTAERARFHSLLDGPDWAGADAASCVQSRCWPVLVADDAGADAVLVAPLILADHPAIAPESAGDLFDATEIDEILTLRVMTMTEQEKADARGTDPRAAAILARCDSMTDSALERLHGARRDEGLPVHGDDLPWWDAGQDAHVEPEKDAVLVAGVPVAKGSRVLLRPSRRADAQDLFLAGLTAVVARVYFDVDGGTHLGVMLEDDPGGDLYGATGRFYYFAPDEVEPLAAREDAR
ncbi:MAG: hypothetical protein JWN87_1912 [Frankiales bacterium]|nr:hypothetical protein [Frankiales bacterium]